VEDEKAIVGKMGAEEEERHKGSQKVIVVNISIIW
jgi:hypothetical protein